MIEKIIKTEQIEISDLDLRYENCRVRSKSRENKLLVSISTKGIQTPLQGAETQSVKILLNGFKRYRCAKKLNINIVPYVSLQHDEALAIIDLIRLGENNNLEMIEQAKLIDVLRNNHKMSISEIADKLGRSVGWVGMRSGIIKEMSAKVLNHIMKGEFPARSYLYNIAPFTRVKKNQKEEVENFINLVANKNFSTRDIDLLATNYFNGSKQVKNQLNEGSIEWSLEKLKNKNKKTITVFNETETRVLKHLEITQIYMHRLALESKDNRFKSKEFFVKANLLTKGILNKIDDFTRAMKELHAKS